MVGQKRAERKNKVTVDVRGSKRVIQRALALFITSVLSVARWQIYPGLESKQAAVSLDGLELYNKARDSCIRCLKSDLRKAGFTTIMRFKHRPLVLNFSQMIAKDKCSFAYSVNFFRQSPQCF